MLLIIVSGSDKSRMLFIETGVVDTDMKGLFEAILVSSPWLSASKH